MKHPVAIFIFTLLGTGASSPLTALARNQDPAPAAPAVSSAKDLADFNRALKFGMQDKSKQAHAIIDRLLVRSIDAQGNPQGGVSRDRLLLTKGRLVYQDGDAREAIRFYDQVPSESDYWIEALEEKSWAHLRLGEHGPALAVLKTLKAPMFQPLLGPEPYFLTGMIHLKICDYPAIFDAIRTFKANYRGRLVEMQKLARTGTSEAAQKAIGKLRTGPIAWKTIASEAGRLPRLFHRDSEFIRLTEKMKTGAGDAGPVLGRLKELAKRDLSEINDILQKMHLLEAEVIQRIHIAEKPKNRPNRHIEVDKDEDILVFADTGEFWFDELDHFHVKVQGCPPLATGGEKL